MLPEPMLHQLPTSASTLPRYAGLPAATGSIPATTPLAFAEVYRYYSALPLKINNNHHIPAAIRHFFHVILTVRLL